MRPSSTDGAPVSALGPAEHPAPPHAGPRGGAPSRGPAIGYQRWDELLLLHWAVPPIPTLGTFHELNLRTYVRAGGVSGLWFLSLDAASAPAVAIARATLGLPYFRARMWRSASAGAHAYGSERLAVRGPRAAFAATWEVGGPAPSPPGSLDHFLAERYALFTRTAGRLVRVRVRHAPWALREARVGRLEQTLARAAGLWVPERPDLAHFSEGRDVEVLPPELAG